MVFGGIEKFTLIDYPGKVACILYTIGCNFRCPYCHNPELVEETTDIKISEAEVFDFLDTRNGMLDGVVITGGEPTIHPELTSVMEKIKSKGFLVKLDSNGTNPALLEESIKRNLVDYIAMDIKAPFSKYAETVNRSVNLANIEKSIKLIMASGVEYEFRTTVIKSLLSPSDIEEIGKEIKGAKHYFLQKFVSNKILNPQFKKKTTYSNDEFQNIKSTLLNYVEHCEIR